MFWHLNNTLTRFGNWLLKFFFSYTNIKTSRLLSFSLRKGNNIFP